MVFKGQFYTIDAAGVIYTSQDGIIWSIVSDKIVKKLLAVDNNYLYVFDGTGIFSTTDLKSWKLNGAKDLRMLPEECWTSVSYNTRTNSLLQVDVLAGLTSQNTQNAVVWYKISSATASDQQWHYIAVTKENKYALPALDNLSLFHYNDALYALGGDNSSFYKSEDNGITWRTVTQYQYPPLDLIANKHVGLTVQDKYIWMIQTSNVGNVKIWKGILNKFE